MRDVAGRRQWRAFQRLWWRSLPLRVLISTLGLSIVVMVLAGVVLMRLASVAIVDAKRQASLTEATGVHNFMQEQLRTPESRGVAVHESLGRLADLANEQGAQYRVVIQAPGLNLVSTGIDAQSVPDSLRERVQESPGMFVTPTRVRYNDPDTASEPGIVVGTSLVGATGERYPIYYIFPLTTERQTLASLQGAVAGTGALLVLALGLIAYLVTQQIVRPVRRASSAALNLASGKLDERMKVRGTDDLASLARSMNQMAGQLQLRIRELENLSTLQQRFVSDVSHELRTPMTTIKMASDMLYDARGDFDPVTARSVELMSSEIERFNSMLSDLLEISRFDAGAAVLALDEFDVGALVRAEVAAAEPVAQAMGATLVLGNVPESTTAEIDPRRISRILRNLLTNAIEHGEGNPIEISVAAVPNSVRVTVRDHGIGLTEEQAQRVFERFWRADPSRNRVVGGSGLGLAIAQEDARLHGGQLTARAHPGDGAEFTLTLPRHPDLAEDPQVHQEER